MLVYVCFDNTDCLRVWSNKEKAIAFMLKHFSHTEADLSTEEKDNFVIIFDKGERVGIIEEHEIQN